MIRGYYSFRLVSTKNPNPGVGGMYATDNGRNQQVILDTIEEFSRQKVKKKIRIASLRVLVTYPLVQSGM